jgi:hypothetical protein
MTVSHGQGGCAIGPAVSDLQCVGYAGAGALSVGARPFTANRSGPRDPCGRRAAQALGKAGVSATRQGQPDRRQPVAQRDDTPPPASCGSHLEERRFFVSLGLTSRARYGQTGEPSRRDQAMHSLRRSAALRWTTGAIPGRSCQSGRGLCCGQSMRQRAQWGGMPVEAAIILAWLTVKSHEVV